jgi:hypothetical protein
MTYKDLGEQCGYSGHYIECVANGRVGVTDEFARRVSEVLELPADELFAGIEP